MSKSFIYNKPTIACRVINRKGKPRYIASYRRGSLKAIIRFASPSKIMPIIFFKILSTIDFRFYPIAKKISISENFLKEVSSSLNIPIHLIGLYIGEHCEQQKLVAIDISGKSRFVLKIAMGSKAEASIKREIECEKFIRSNKYWNYTVPQIFSVNDICGRKAIHVERIDGRQMTLKEFEKEFLNSNVINRILGSGSSIGKWIDNLNLDLEAENIKSSLKDCNDCGAFDLLSPLGTVHGDFGPWNIIIRNKFNSMTPSISKIFRKKIIVPSDSLYAIDLEFYCNNTPIIFDYAYAIWCYHELLNRNIHFDQKKQLIALGKLWMELRTAL